MDRLPTPTFDEFARFVAELTGINFSRLIPSARVERDLGVTGDDGDDLLQALVDRYGTDFTPLGPNVHLFHSEGLDLAPIIRWIFRRAGHKVLPVTMQDLYDATVRGYWADPQDSASKVITR